MKTIKIAPAVHRELKRYVADNPNDNMADFAGLAIMEALKAAGHKFSVPIKQDPKKNK